MAARVERSDVDLCVGPNRMRRATALSLLNPLSSVTAFEFIMPPVVFLVFNRPDVTERVFERIREAKPEQLFVVADGARIDRPGESEKVAATRAITERVDWPCEVHRNYSEINLGCGRRVSSGITWAFEQVEEAIILEDDCLPHPSFFHYCAELLQRYRDDERVMTISGDNFQRGIRRGDASYYFSKYMHCWGWATWRRAWQHFAPGIDFWPDVRESGCLSAVCFDDKEREYWTGIFERVYTGEIDTWDYPWLLCIWMQSGLNALPNVNLVTNIGFGADATHTRGELSDAVLPVADIGPLTHPRFLCRNADADALTRTEHFAVPMGITPHLRQRTPPRAADMASECIRLLARLVKSVSVRSRTGEPR